MTKSTIIAIYNISPAKRNILQLALIIACSIVYLETFYLSSTAGYTL